jgi:hypothetical protein
MLESCTDIEKLQITQSLCQDILAAVVDGTLPIGESTNSIISDALTILASKDIKLKANRAGGAAEEDGDEVPEVASKAKAALISKVRVVWCWALCDVVCLHVVPHVMYFRCYPTDCEEESCGEHHPHHHWAEERAGAKAVAAAEEPHGVPARGYARL